MRLAAHTGIKEPEEPFRFSFPDLNGNVVSNTDDRFAQKVVLVNIGASWCPNCHDEAPFLVDRPAGVWTFINSRGFPAMTVPAGFTTQVYDRVRITQRDTTQRDSTRLTGPIPARLPVGIDFLSLPFGEPMLLRIASAYEARTKHRAPPPGFGPLPARQSLQR